MNSYEHSITYAILDIHTHTHNRIASHNGHADTQTDRSG